MNLANTPESISVFNLSGIKVNTLIVEANSDTIIEITTPGVYIVKSGKASQKLIITD